MVEVEVEVLEMDLRGVTRTTDVDVTAASSPRVAGVAS